jgi:two-component system heavy metal sensor histidine kinase CusS
MSITARLVFLYSFSAFAVLLVCSLFLYETLESNLDREKLQFLADEVATLREVQADHGEDVDSLLEEVRDEADVRHFSRYYVRILEGGSLLLESTAMGELLPARVFPAAVGEQESPAKATIYVAPDGRRFLLVTARARAGAPTHPLREIQIAVDDSSRDEITADYRRSMGWTIVLGTLASTLAAALIARGGLRPLQHITRRARGISASQLHERIGSEVWPTELVELASAFDEMLERLEQSFEQLSQFSADLAHELRTPINNLMGEAEVALSRGRGAGEYQRVLGSSLEELGRLSRMIDSMLFLARAEKAESPLQLARFEVHSELELVREFYDALAEQRGVTLTCSGNASLRADPILFRRALGNLLSNALEYTSAGGKVSLLAETSAGAVLVRVEDTGSGVAPEHLPHLFDRFYRGDPARSGHPQGTGLGLAIVKSIVELHGGSVSISSRLGLGTSVLLRFPVTAG